MDRTCDFSGNGRVIYLTDLQRHVLLTSGLYSRHDYSVPHPSKNRIKFKSEKQRKPKKEPQTARMSVKTDYRLTILNLLTRLKRLIHIITLITVVIVRIIMHLPFINICSKQYLREKSDKNAGNRWEKIDRSLFGISHVSIYLNIPSNRLQV